MVNAEQRDDDFLVAAKAHLDALCKPPGSLGALESVAINLCKSQQSLSPATHPRRAVIFAADHGINLERVSAWPSEVTRAVVRVMQSGTSASGVFCEATRCEYEIVNVGLLKDPTVRKRPIDALIPPDEHEKVFYFDCPIRAGTSSFLHQPAMTSDEFEACWKVGEDRALEAHQSGMRMVIGGEMGIANTSSASCIYSLLLGLTPEQSVGPGAGADEAGLTRKRNIVRRSINRVRESTSAIPSDDQPAFAKAIACEVGGFEIVALAGFYAKAAQLGLTIVLDGFITTASALIAESIYPGTVRAMLAGHCSEEPAHRAGLAKLKLDPILDLGMRLGEGTGALAALGIIDLAGAMCSKMATLSDLELM